ncbi:50S ribosomal protein L25/general stress protein Ctc [Brooklawnia cerclae]|uniref:Large ribosomal subunit protein bL25 n=1 Tax=Brooklawnia cerclae TaxID=349934 RepID=A0ABX0SHI3_9ACTN|nr:50S ribosomal protein L25/general stress protein Ctc [Brooklawnia cerclae]NIH57860.1 large subunit ribosomal protein L25 [Brooklawnia cerclae]
MADTIKLNAEARDEFGKGAARRIRRQHKIPAVLYGHGSDPIHITLPGHETMLALRQANALLSLDMPGGEEQLALPKQVQRHPVRGEIEHVDLLIVKRGEKVTVPVPIVVVGELVEDTVVNQERNELHITAEATNIPADIEISVEGLPVGTQVFAADVKLPEGVELHDDPESLVLVVSPATAAEDLEASTEAEEPEAAEAGAEDEVKEEE